MDKKDIAVFSGKRVRRQLFNNEWHFSIVDVIEILTDSNIPRRYWSDLKRKLKEEGYAELYENIVQLKMEASDGKKYETDCANMEGIFRIIQSIPSPRAEPFKRWLARIGKERIEEIEDPELGMQRTKALYEKKGYPKDMKVEEHKKHKGLMRENLRDHMTDLELIIAMLGEAATTRITQDRNSNGLPKLQRDAKDGGAVAGRTRKDIERQTRTKIVSKENFLPENGRKQIKGGNKNGNE